MRLEKQETPYNTHQKNMMKLYLRSMRKRKQTTPMMMMMSPGTMKDMPQLEETQ